MSTSKKNKPKSNSPKMTPQQFIADYAKKQTELLAGLMQCVKDGEIRIDDSQATDEYIATIVDAWCEQEEPRLDMHMKMSGAIFLWALLDQVYGVDEPSTPGVNATQDPFADIMNHPGIVVGLEVLKTVRAIWGKNG